MTQPVLSYNAALLEAPIVLIFMSDWSILISHFLGGKIHSETFVLVVLKFIEL